MPRVTKAMLEQRIEGLEYDNNRLTNLLRAEREKVAIYERVSSLVQAANALHTASNLADSAGQLAKSSAYLVDRSRLHPEPKDKE